ncbi:MAG TPA: hypothetical protein VNY82_09135 [Steroidobacteraceae bacterium]|nr:hypothetical protein [Steroidobacteraceae bacterium]
MDMTVGYVCVDVCSGVEKQVDGLEGAGLDVNFPGDVEPRAAAAPYWGAAHGYGARARERIDSAGHAPT